MLHHESKRRNHLGRNEIVQLHDGRAVIGVPDRGALVDGPHEPHFHQDPRPRVAEDRKISAAINGNSPIVIELANQLHGINDELDGAKEGEL